MADNIYIELDRDGDPDWPWLMTSDSEKLLELCVEDRFTNLNDAHEAAINFISHVRTEYGVQGVKVYIREPSR